MNFFHILPKLAASFAVALLAVAISSGASFAANDYVGKYKTVDTQGNPMEITLSADGTASGQRAGESLSGKWKAGKKGAAVIQWQDGWVTRLSKKGDSYRKKSFKKGDRDSAKKAKAEKVE